MWVAVENKRRLKGEEQMTEIIKPADALLKGSVPYRN